MNKRQHLLHPYPFQRLAELKQGIQANTRYEHIALSIGEPQHAPPAFVNEILASGIQHLAKYPLTSGSPELKESIASWIHKRFKATVHTDALLPVNGSREALFALAQSIINPSDKAVVLLPNPFYQIYEGAALMAGAEPYYYDTDEENNFQPDWSSIPEAIWKRVRLVYTCSPGNPTGKVLSADCLNQLIQLSDEYDFIIAGDECYSEIFPNEATPPLGMLDHCQQIGREDFKNCITFNSLSKRSNLPGLRSGFVAGDQSVIKHFLQYRTYHGSAMPLLTQKISQAAWLDEEHVIANRQAYDRKYASVLPILNQSLTCTRPDAAFFIWLKTPTQYNDEQFAQALFKEYNITVLPGSYLARSPQGNAANPGSKYVRIALVAAEVECINAAQRIHEFTQNHPN